jgi:hypothetical protein
LSRIEVAEGFLLAYIAALLMIVRAFVPVLRLIKDIIGAITEVLDVLRKEGATSDTMSTSGRIIGILERTIGSKDRW